MKFHFKDLDSPHIDSRSPWLTFCGGSMYLLELSQWYYIKHITDSCKVNVQMSNKPLISKKNGKLKSIK